MYIRYKLIMVMTSETNKLLRRLCLASLISGELSQFGIVLIGNFRADSADRIHLFGAGLMFFLGTAYIVLDTIITALMEPKLSPHYMLLVRIVISSLSAILLISAVTGKFISEDIWMKHYPNYTRVENYHMQMKWDSTQPGYEAHLVGSVCQWIVCALFVSYIMTFITDSRNVTACLHIELISDLHGVNGSTRPTGNNTELVKLQRF